MSNGWIKLHRSMLDWEWYGDGNTMRLFIHLLLTASREEGEYHGVALHPGYAVASYSAIERVLGMTEKMARVAFEHLKRTGEISLVYSDRNGSVWSVNNWREYQLSADETTSKTAELLPCQDEDDRNSENVGKNEGQEKGQGKWQENEICKSQDNNDLQLEKVFEGQEKGQEKGHPHIYKKIKNINSLYCARTRTRGIEDAHAREESSEDFDRHAIACKWEIGFVPYPKTAADVVAAAAIAGMAWDERMASAFLDHYNATGWQSQTGPLRDWRYKLRKWFEYEKAYKPNQIDTASMDRRDYSSF